MQGFRYVFCGFFQVLLACRNPNIYVLTVHVIFPAPGLCSLFACANMLYRRLVVNVIEIFVLLHTSYFLKSTVVPKRVEIESLSQLRSAKLELNLKHDREIKRVATIYNLNTVDHKIVVKFDLL